ncbi:SMI1/KNR4 family protein [Pseudomonas mangrovi]|uniref:SMI1/KNR4 family protein n=1 Tax=Pseudomonas mangrovi TaxID=2161748 RepID=UPI0013048CB8|nr:SMI1/KNR4 family protein [Pseudomonas mangrovi]
MEWDTSICESQPLSAQQIEGFEKITGFNLPADYREIVQRFPNSYPSKSSFRVNVGNELFIAGFGILMTLNPFSEHENVLSTLIRLRKHQDLPENLLPFAAGGGGDYLCFSYSSSAIEPSVVFWFHEVPGPEGVYPVAENFAGLLDILFTEAD